MPEGFGKVGMGTSTCSRAGPMLVVHSEPLAGAGSYACFRVWEHRRERVNPSAGEVPRGF
jgi:hypothetical protein